MTPSLISVKLHDLGIADPRKLVLSFVGFGVGTAKPVPVPMPVKRTHIRRHFKNEKERNHFYYEQSKRRAGA